MYICLMERKLVSRKDYLQRLWSFKDQDLIKVITGFRRAGKSTLLDLFKNELLRNGIHENQIHFYNFELPENYLRKTWEEIYYEIKSKLAEEHMNYIFLDEIQNIENFELLVDGLFATENTDVYITGSNAKLLSSELATLLSGRHVEISILPFSFAEYLTGRGIDIQNRYLNYEALFFDYINETSLPKGITLREKGHTKLYDYLDAVYTTVVVKDIMQRHKIYDKRAFRNLTAFLAGQLGSPVSPAGISKALKADGKKIHHLTVQKYLDYLTDSFVFYHVSRFDIKGKKQLATLEKYYIVDPGLLNIMRGREKKADRGHILENVVFLELLRRGYKVWTGKTRDAEVDFVVKTPSGDIHYYQVAWQLSGKDTLEREFKPLESIKDNYPKFLLTTDSFTENRNGIVHKNVFDWFLEEER